MAICTEGMAVDQMAEGQGLKGLWVMYFMDQLCKGIQISSVARSCPTLCDPMNRSTPGFPVHHQLPELASTHVHWISDAIQPSHPLSSVPFSSFLQAQHQGFFQWVGSSHQLAKVLELQFQLQHQSFQWIFRTDILYRMDWLDLLAVQGILKSLLQHHGSKHQFLGAQLSLWSSSHVCIWLLEKPQLYRPLSAKTFLFLICGLGLSWLSFQGANVF